MILVLETTSTSFAGLILRYSGEVNLTDDPFGIFSGVQLGDTVTGELQYDLPDAFFDYGDMVQYTYNVMPGGINRMIANVGVYSLTPSSTIYLQTYDPNSFSAGVDFQFLDGDSSMLSAAGLPAGFQIGSVGAYVGLFTQSFRSSISFPAPPTTILELSQYDDPITGGFLFADVLDANSNYQTTAFVGFSLNSIQAVPEPSSIATAGVFLGLLVVRKRIADLLSLRL